MRRARSVLSQVPVNLKRIYIRNFESIKEATVEFPKSGLCLVVGHNKTKSSVESIGSGKTALGEAISRTLLGARGRYKGQRLSAYSADHCGNKNTLIELECDLNGKTLKVWSAYRCKDFSDTGEALRFEYDGKITERGSIDETRAELSALLSMSSLMAEHTIFVDGAKLRFDDLSEQQLVDLFLTCVTQTNWVEAQARVKKTIEDTEDEQQEIVGKISACKRMLEDSEAKIESLKTRVPQLEAELEEQKETRQGRIATAAKKVESCKASIAEIKKKQAEIKSKIKELEKTKAEEFAKVELKISRTRSKIAEVTKEVDSLNRAVGGAKKDLASSKAKREKLDEPDTCPTCGKPWDKRHSERAIQEADAEVTEKRKILTETSNELDSAEEKRSSLNEELRSYQTELRNSGIAAEISELSEDYEKTENDIEELQEELANFERQLTTASKPVDETPLVLAKQKVADVEENIRKINDEIDQHTAQNVELSTTLAVLNYWHKAFGPTGLPNMILGDAVGYINHASAYLSNVLTGGLLEISYSTTKLLANSSEKPEVVINVKNATGAKKFLGASKGEAGISNLVIAETLYEIGRCWQKVGYRWLDEAVNSQDRMVRGSVYSYMREQSRLRGVLTFVVDHNQEVEAFADHILIAEKSKDGFTTYRWATVT